MHEKTLADELFPIGHAARRIVCSAEWLRKLCNDGRIQHVRDASGRRLISGRAIEEFLATRREATRKAR